MELKDHQANHYVSYGFNDGGGEQTVVDTMDRHSPLQKLAGS
jgi:hypothetical protein